ncbi:CPBP family glutamic-type intramembrane protease [Sphingomonas sp. LB-2]|uniref:CPBP family glutamic-type intramembrane protease n=1 Tax=Sphingomonas caeni TaxID=2984949 RepID=UPI0022320E14|nr:CPBP family glutamic-type intramembrane protease [Sphingomonas caeni]MCW3846739.1 CPBP family glutamic-type intramembrane protease [Sphingomonas caeni]
MTLAWRRIEAALRSWPDRRGWIATGVTLLWCLPLLGLIGGLGGFAHLDPLPFGVKWVRIFFLVMLVPALAEELLFRALLVPRPDKPFPVWQAVLTVTAFVVWHPFQAYTFGPPWSALFLDPWFVAATALLGAALVRLYRVTGSIWPGVAVHWLVVAGWKLLFGGPFG